MSGWGLLTPVNAWLLALLGPLVVFYFLKLKRPRMEIPSLVLWRQVLQDSRVNAPFQRFKRNLLLLLQIALLCLLALAAMQPFLRGDAGRASRLPILIDCSASMGALDKSGRSRLSEAKEKVRDRIDNLMRDQELCLIAFGRTARKLTGFTNNKRILREALDRIEVEDLPSDIEDAMRVTEALARTAAFDEVLLLSDGNFPMKTDFELSFAMRYQRMAPAGRNLGITSLNARRAGSGGWDVFVRIEACGERSSGTVRLAMGDGGQPESRAVALKEGEAERLAFRVPGGEASRVTVRLAPDGFDALTCDNIAAIDLPVARTLRVFCPKEMAAYRHALRAAEGVEVFPDDADDADAEPYDLVISDRPEHASLRAGTFCGVGFVPDALADLVSAEEKGATVIDWRRGSPLLQHVELGEVVILDRLQAREGVGDADFESAGYEVLAHGRVGPLIVQRRWSDRVAYHLLFHSDRSTFPYRVGFPIFVSNLVQIGTSRSGLAEVRGVRTGVLPALKLAANRACAIRGPGGMARTETTDKDGILSGVPAPRVGEYAITGGGEPLRLVAALLDAGESGLRSLETIEFNEGLTVTASTVAARTDKPLWPTLALVAFCVLLFEWWYYQKRPGRSAR